MAHGELANPSPKRSGHKVKQCLRTNTLTLLLMLSVFVGVGLGILLRNVKESWTKREIMYINFPGDLFLRMIKCLILPLISSSLISAIGGLDLRISGKIGFRSVIYYMTTTILAVILGIVLVVSMQPGESRREEGNSAAGTVRNVTVPDTMLDLVRNLFPPNIIEACISQFRTVLIYPGQKRVLLNITNETMWDNPNATIVEVPGENGTNESFIEIYTESPMTEWDTKGEFADGTNILGIVMFSIAFGIALGHVGEKGKGLLDVFVAIGDVMMMITRWVIWLSPIGITFLVTSKILEIDDFGDLVGKLGMYTLTVLIGLAIHGMLVLPLIFVIITRKAPFRFIFNMVQALTTAWGTSSSSASLPVTIACLEEKNFIDPRISRFVIPIGATINMDGTALYEAVGALFIAQVRGIPMDLGTIIAVSITATAASIGAAGIPQAGLVTMVMVLNAVGLPADDVTLIFVVDWLLDRFRTMINVLGDSLGAGIVSHLSQKELDDFNVSIASDKTGTLTSNGSVTGHSEILENQNTSM